jgi:SAM-dependent methyltransferase
MSEKHEPTSKAICACRSCGGSDLVEVLDLGRTPIGDAYVKTQQQPQEQETFPLRVVVCTNCSCAQITEVIDPWLLYGAFTYKTSISPGLTDHFENYAEALHRYLQDKANSFVVDIGSNDGTLLSCFMKRNCRVLGVEPASEIANDASSRGINTINGFFSSDIADQIVAKYGYADLVTSNNTMANIDSLDQFLEHVSTILNDNGVFCFETGYWPAIVDDLLFDTIYHEHLTYFTLRSLDAALKSQGLRLIDAKKIPTKGGSIRAIAAKQESKHEASRNVHDILAEEIWRGLDNPDSYLPFAKRVFSIKKEFKETLRKLHSQKKRVCGYGASVGVTTLIYFFEVANHLEFLVDDNLAKVGLRSPGVYLPVYGTEYLYQAKPDYAAIFAWRYRDQIRDRHNEFRNQGGKFVEFLPEFRVQ